MNLLYDHSIFRLQRYGGISRYFYELITRLSAIKEVNINLFEGFHVNEYGLSNYKNGFALYTGYKVPEIQYAGYAFEIFNKFWFKRNYSKLDIDIYHPTYYRKDLGAFKKTPIVLTVYDMIHELYASQFWNSKWVIESKSESIKAADIIICISENTKKDLIKIYDVPEEKVKVVYLANSLQKSNLVSFENLKLNYNINKPYILYVGDRRAHKNFQFLLEVYASQFSKKYDLVCFGGGNITRKESDLIKKFDLSKNVIQVHGNDTMLASWYKNSFCFIYPSLYEGFGIPLLEAMAMECPIIASNTSSIPEVVGEAGILFDPQSRESLINALESLVNSDSKRSKLIILGKQQEKKFSWDKMANETLDIYKSII
jgi:glycosyltransferase involved in cell wall biosynthesis